VSGPGNGCRGLVGDHVPAGEAELLAIANAAADAGAEELLKRFGGELIGLHAKTTPTDPVSAADLAAEAAIRAVLNERRPADSFLGEEGGSVQGEGSLRWVVDPLDGTVNFLFGIPQWCVSVAVRDVAGTIAGAVYDPNRDELFTATRTGPATLERAEGTIELGEPGQAGTKGPAGAGESQTGGSPGARGGDLATAMVATGLAYDANVRSAQARVLVRLVPRVRDIRRFGSAALDLTWTAAGRYDAYFERTVKQWDIAAGALICERAGLRVLELPVHEDLPWGILVAPPALAEPLLELVG